jgi:predicted transcriptional regulator with HTH domain
MSNDIRHKEMIRGKILFYLALVYPHSTSMSLLQGELDIFGYPVPMDDMNFHVAYLAEKGFVGVEIVRGPSRHTPMKLVTITAKGIDYNDGRLPADHGVYLEPQS